MGAFATLIGASTPYIWAMTAYGFFMWLDRKASEDAKTKLAQTTIWFRDNRTAAVASVLVEAFDLVYTRPLLRWRAFARSMTITAVISVFYMFEVRHSISSFPADVIWLTWRELTYVLFFNAVSDYVSLFVIRPVLSRCGSRPVISLVLGAVCGIAIVFAVVILRGVVDDLLVAVGFQIGKFPHMPDEVAKKWFMIFIGALLPAFVVFAWLPLFAIGILAGRLLTPLTWMVGKMQWVLKEGEEHPFEAIGYVAAVVVFVCVYAGRAAIRAL